MRTGVGIAVLFVALAGTAGSAAASGGAFVPPLQVEVGHAVMASADGGAVESTQVLVGISWASLYPRDTPIDIAAGFVTNIRPADDSMASARVVGTEDETDVVSGGYLYLAARGAAGRHWRTWIGGRGEVLHHERSSTLGAAARASVELWTGGFEGAHNGFVLGTVAVSAWAEYGVRGQPYDGAATFVAAGLGMRVPLIIAGH